MSWWGKVIGGAFGFMFGGPLGALLGAAVGHNFDRGFDRIRLEGVDSGPEDVERIQTAFFTTTFSVMGHLAKADGRVSEDEIGFARAVMANMQLDEAQRRAAINLFREGKDDDFPLDEVLEQFRRESRRRRNLLRMFLEIQLRAAFADGTLDAAEQRLLERIAEALGFSHFEYKQMEAMARAEQHFFAGGAGQGRAEPPRQRGPSLADAYAILGVSESASDSEVKKAYRRLMNQHHPDKLVAKGLPEEMVKVATEKTQEIKSAYDAVKQARGMR